MSDSPKIKLIKAERSRAELTLLHELISADPVFANMVLQFKDAPVICDLIHRNPERAKEFLRRLRGHERAAA